MRVGALNQGRVGGMGGRAGVGLRSIVFHSGLRERIRTGGQKVEKGKSPAPKKLPGGMGAIKNGEKRRSKE